MSAAGVAGVSRGTFVTTTVKSSDRQAPDLVDRNFTAERPNLLRVADITYIPTWAGFLYLAVVLDACSRRIVGWSMAKTLATRLVLDALNMALAVRRPLESTQHTSIEFGHRCREAGVRPSMGLVGDVYDNAMCESLFATLECELLDSRRFKTQAEARIACSSSSRASTTRAAVIHQSGISLRSTYERRHAANPDAHQPAAVLASVKDKPSGRPRTEAVLDRRSARRPHQRAAGMEEWLRRGPNKRMTPNRGAKCRQTKYPDPKPSPLHGTGASPGRASDWIGLHLESPVGLIPQARYR
jgi:transposase InsO family protein